MKAFRKPITQTRRDAWVEVNLSYIEHNFNELKKLLNPDVKVMAIVKADAYGHGAAMVAKILSAIGVSYYGVAAVDEGIQLRSSDIKKPILVLGPTPGWALSSAVEYNLDITIFSETHLAECIETAEKLKKKVNVHVKVDTGMHRIGINYLEANALIEKIQKAKGINLCSIFSHLACAEDAEASKLQIDRWNNVISNIENKPPLLHFVNSAGINAYKDIHYNLVRTGIEIYGLAPDLPEGVPAPDLKQAMALKGRITHLHEATSGEGISYGHRFQVKDNNITVATLPVGYADGVSRKLSGKIYGAIKGIKVPQIGSISMDQMMFDVSEVPDIQVGDIISLLGYDNEVFLSIDNWANILETINYEIPCLLKVRLPRVFTS